MGDAWNDLLLSHRGALESAAPSSGQNRHRPRAAVLSCADARVSPSAVFAQEPGALFTVRIAGNTASPAAIASLDYAVEQLDVGLVVVMGHTDCGAVAAAMAGSCDGRVGEITGQICETVRRHPHAGATEISERNVGDTIAALTLDPGPTGMGTRNGTVAVVGVIHDLETGALRPVPPAPLPVH